MQQLLPGASSVCGVLSCHPSCTAAAPDPSSVHEGSITRSCTYLWSVCVCVCVCVCVRVCVCVCVCSCTQILYEPHTADGQPCPDQAVLLDPQTSLGTFAPAPKHIHTDARGQPRSRQMAGGNDIVTPRTRVWPGGGPGHVWGGTARAATPCEVAVVTQEQWLQLVQDEPRWDARQVRVYVCVKRLCPKQGQSHVCMCLYRC